MIHGVPNVEVLRLDGVLDDKDFARFISRIKVKNFYECWEWIGGTVDKDGYGRISIKGKLIRVNRLSYLVFCGDIPDGLWALHRCDNPGCCNPHHLFLGTSDDNIKDMINKGRNPKGESSGMSKLTSSGIGQIIQMHTEFIPQQIIANKLNVTRSIISKVMRYELWKESHPHLDRYKIYNNYKLKLAEELKNKIKIIQDEYALGNINQRELCKKYNIPRSTINRWVNLVSYSN